MLLAEPHKGYDGIDSEGRAGALQLLFLIVLHLCNTNFVVLYVYSIDPMQK